ncbi:unnamed protein product [Schistosoma mattheei]|uniref:Uncharacterized protein n=1 Tax=Schistosoma mattheei TaxID=31246 RepID=A0A3P8F669_9TREM|nr:unnamed protein product [Schistosoma mattheei]
MISTCQEVFGHNKLHHKEQISMETLNRIQERKNKKSTINDSQTRTEEVDALARYTEANKKVRKSIRADKQKYVEDPARTADKATTERNMRQLYDTTKFCAENNGYDYYDLTDLVL